MICPQCGADINEDTLYCEKCGTEFQIVPEIDVDFERSMGETMSQIVDNEFTEYETCDDDELEYGDVTILSWLFSKHKLGFLFYIAIALVLIVIIYASLHIVNTMKTQSSKEYQIEMAQKALADNDIHKAIDYYQEAYNSDKNDCEILFTIADLYYTLEQNDDAIIKLEEIAQTDDFPLESREEAYLKIIQLYSTADDYENVKNVLEKCDIPSVVEDFKDYLAPEPTYSMEEGTYKETIAVKLSSDIPGTIHYSLDGTVPGPNSPVYESPIFLEYGNYTIRSVFINEKGVSSEPVSKNYLIDVAFSFEPDVLTESGMYTKATLIEVDVPSQYTVYYTNDGTDPDKSSNKYLYPIPLPLGHSSYKFISYAMDGTPSSIVEKDYNISIQTDITPAIAVNMLVEGLVQRGYLSGYDGTKEGVVGRYLYIYSVPYPISGIGSVYFIVEYFEDASGNQYRTNKNFAVDCSTGSLYTVEKSGKTSYVLNGL